MQEQTKAFNPWAALAIAGAASLCALGTIGCTSQIGEVPVTPTGHVRGGASAVAHATIQLYASGSNGYGSASTPLLSSSIVSDASGNFNLPHTYTCPGASTPVYLLATGGDGGHGVNPNIALVSALGPCGSIDTSSIIINEITTVAAVYALQPFMAGPTGVGSTPGNAKGLIHAFATAARLADVSSGAAPGLLPAGASAPTSAMNTLADILAACVDTAGGSASDGSACGRLFAATRSNAGAAPTDTLSALLSIARNPGRNVAALLALASAQSPYQPYLAATDFTLALKYKPSLSHPSAAAVDAQGNVWVTNAGSNSVSVVDATGAPLAGSPFQGGNLSQPSAVAIDAAGNAWVTNRASSTLSAFTPTGAGVSSGITGLCLPSSIAIDASGVLWIASQGSSSVSAVTVSGTKALSATSYSTGGIDAPTAIAVNPF